MYYRICSSCHLPTPAPDAVCPACHSELKDPLCDGTQLAGAVIEDHYRLEQFLGQGSMAWVYRGTHADVGASVAVKLLKPAVAKDPAIVVRFRKEAAAVSLLSHPHVLTVMAAGQTPSGIHYMVSEYIQGKTLAEIIREQKQLPLRRATDILQQILAGLEEAHAKGVVHRDLKPENIMVMALRGGGDFCKIVDFGIALRRLPEEERLTRHGEIVGTPEFMAPEVIRGQEATPQADLYAVGLIYYEMLTGELPFPKSSMIETLLMRLNRDPVPIRNKMPSIPSRVENILQRALEKEPAKRFASASEFLEALQSESSITTQLCPSCLQPVHSNQKFCPHCGRIQDNASPEDKAALHPAGTLPQAFAVPFWGRDAELESVKEFILQDALFLEVTGETGTGRMALIQEAMQYISAHHGHRMANLCPDVLGARPWHPWRRLLGRELGFPETPRRSIVEDACRRLGLDAEDIPHILTLFGIREETDMEAAVRRREMIVSVARLALAVLGKQPVVLVCRNTERLDEPSREVLKHMAKLPTPPDFRVICISVGGWLSRMLGPKQVKSLHLERFSLQESRIFCRETLERNGSRADAGAISRLVETALGLPLHLVEGMRLLHEGISDADKGLPDIIQLRVRNMQGPAHRLLQWLAVAGGRLPLHFLRNSGLFDKEVLDSLTMCLLHGFTVSTNDEEVALAHELYARVVLAETPGAVRTQLHQKLFEQLRIRFDDPRLLCPHALHARNRDVAASYYEHASALCREEFDIAGALAHYQKAYELTEFAARQGQELQRFRHVCLAYGQLLQEAGRCDEALRVLREGQAACIQHDDIDALRMQTLSILADAALSPERAQANAARILPKLLAQPAADSWEPILQLVNMAINQKWFGMGLSWLEKWEIAVLQPPAKNTGNWERDLAKIRCLLELGKTSEALLAGESVLKAMEGKTAWRATARINDELVRCHMMRQDFAGAQQRLQAALAALRFLGDRQALVENQLRLAFLDVHSRTSWAQGAMALAQKIGFSEGIIHAQKLLQP